MINLIAELRDPRWLAAERIRIYALALLGAYLLSCIWLIATSNGLIDSLGRPLGTDFANVWSAGRMVLEGQPQAAFDPRLQQRFQMAYFKIGDGQFYGWHYPPMFMLVAAPLAMLPYTLALLVWLTTTGAMYLASIRRIASAVAVPRSSMVLVALAYPAVFACVTQGQNGFLTAALFGGGLALLPTRPLVAGVLMGLLAYKPQYGLLLPLALVMAGAWRTIASAAATLAATVLISIATLGTQSWLAFFTFTEFTRTTLLEHGGAGWPKMQGVFPAVRMLGGGIELAYGLQAVTSGAMLLVTLWLWRSPASYRQKAAGLLLATMLASPYAFDYDTVLLAPAIAFLVVDGMTRGFAPYEKSLLVLLWATPLFSRALTGLTWVPVATLVHALVLAALLYKARAPVKAALALAPER